VDGADAEGGPDAEGGGREKVSEKKSRLDTYKEIIEKYNLTPEDIRRFIKLTSIYYYYKVNGEGLRPVDVVIEVNPHPSDVMNLIAFAAAWKQFYDNVARVVAQNVSLFASSAMPTDLMKKPESLMAYLLMKQMEQTQQSGLSPEEMEEIDKSVDMERLKKSLEKVKRGGGGEEESEKGEAKGDNGVQNT
jgi:hypothetical protein